MLDLSTVFLFFFPRKFNILKRAGSVSVQKDTVGFLNRQEFESRICSLSTVKILYTVFKPEGFLVLHKNFTSRCV